MRFIIFASIFFFCSVAFSQPETHPVMVPGRTMAPPPVKSYTDSEEFAKLFKEFYPVIKPAKSVREQSDQYFQNMSRSFSMQGIDSAQAASAAFKNLDDKAFEKIYFDIYRKNLSAKELKKYIAFIETPEGKHIADIWTNLQRGPSETMMYVARTLNLNLTSIRQTARDKMDKEHPQKAGQMPPGGIRPGNVDVFDQKNAGSKDSLMNLYRQQGKIPPVKIPAVPSEK